jgi:hypothetical protein
MSLLQPVKVEFGLGKNMLRGTLQNTPARLRSRVARFFLVLDTKNRKNVPIEHKLYQMAKKFPNLSKIFPMAIKYINIFQSKGLQNLPKLGFLV